MTNDTTHSKSLRLWPGVAAAIVLVIARYLFLLVAPHAEVASIPLGIIGFLGGMLCAVLIVVWWLFFSRAPWADRFIALVVFVAAVFVTRLLVDPSIRTGNMGFMPYFYFVPPLAIALVAGAWVTRRLPDGSRRTALVAILLIACAPWLLVRTAGVSGTGTELHWRWTPTPEDRLLAESRDALPPPAAAEAPKDRVEAKPQEPVAVPEALPGPPAVVEVPKEPEGRVLRPGPPPTPASTTPAPALSDPIVKGAEWPAMSDPRNRGVEWPGFRGLERDGVVRGLRIETDWAAAPPKELWRRPIGPGWSSFAVDGDLLYTQEQRGGDEIVACYRVSTGAPVWMHKDPVRFWESNAGAGPRGTPTLSNGRVYTLGATGIANALDARTGARIWSRDALKDTDKTIPDWGIASSPLVAGDLVIFAIAGRPIAYEAATGKTRWIGEPGGAGYSSPHLVTLGGVMQVVQQRGSRTLGLSPADGKRLWEHMWVPAVAITQPALTADGDLLIALHDGMAGQGVKRLAIASGASGWTVQERWTSKGLKPYFNDFVVHEGHAYGFDGSILACIGLENGSRTWKGGRYGQGQMVLLADQDVLLVLSEEGELALVKATPDQFTELARMPALNGKTWNHPVVVGDVLLVRNDQEMVAYRLMLERR